MTEGREPTIKGTPRGYRKGKGVTEGREPRIKGTLRGFTEGEKGLQKDKNPR